MKRLMATSYAGAYDLYHAVPDLNKAEFLGVRYEEDKVTTVLCFKLESGEDFEIFVRYGDA